MTDTYQSEGRGDEIVGQLDMSQPVWTFRHIAKLLGVTPAYVQKNVVKSPGFPAPRRPLIGKSGQIEMNKLYYREDVLTWFDRQPVVLEQSA